MDLTTVSIIIAIVGCLVGLAGWWRNNRNDSGQQKATESEIKTTLDFIQNDIKEMKVDIRSFNRDLQDVRSIAIAAKTEAKRANDRLDNLTDDGR